MLSSLKWIHSTSCSWLSVGWLFYRSAASSLWGSGPARNRHRASSRSNPAGPHCNNKWIYLTKANEFIWYPAGPHCNNRKWSKFLHIGMIDSSKRSSLCYIAPLSISFSTVTLNRFCRSHFRSVPTSQQNDGIWTWGICQIFEGRGQVCFVKAPLLSSPSPQWPGPLLRP